MGFLKIKISILKSDVSGAFEISLSQKQNLFTNNSEISIVSLAKSELRTEITGRLELGPSWKSLAVRSKAGS